MLDINKIVSDINFKNLTKIDVTEILKIPYSTTVNRMKSGNWTPDDIEKFADYFGRPIAYYFDREEKEQKEIKHYPGEEPVNRIEEPKITTYSCPDCIQKEKVIQAQQVTIESQAGNIGDLREHIRLLEFSLGKNLKNGSG
jgi:hypothetical protein